MRWDSEGLELEDRSPIGGVLCLQVDAIPSVFGGTHHLRDGNSYSMHGIYLLPP